MNYKEIDINGLIVAAFSPFNVDGSINIKPIPKLVDNLIDNGINGFYLMGSTGEGLSIAVKQRKEITDAYMEAINNRVKIKFHFYIIIFQKKQVLISKCIHSWRRLMTNSLSYLV